jgi:hypothetical protein
LPPGLRQRWLRRVPPGKTAAPEHQPARISPPFAQPQSASKRLFLPLNPAFAARRTEVDVQRMKLFLTKIGQFLEFIPWPSDKNFCGQRKSPIVPPFDKKIKFRLHFPFRTLKSLHHEVVVLPFSLLGVH